ncbi:MAG TPA: ribonuclease III [Pseudomonadales bacterium]
MTGTTTSKSDALARLQARLNYHFNDRALLEQALTHKSHSRQHNERLEFLGDAVLGCVVAEALYRQHPGLAEDSLTLLRAQLVKKDTLSGIAVELGLGEFLRLGSGERKSGGRQRGSILADALEAVIGAVSLDGGIEAARLLVHNVYGARLEGIDSDSVSKDSKTTLQELLQARSLPLPRYEVIATAGSEHKRTFTVSCLVEDLQLETTGRGSSRRAAEKAAAEAMIGRLGDHE